MSKKQGTVKYRPLKPVDEAAVAHFGLNNDHEQPSSRKRLKKLSQVNHHEELVEDGDTEKLEEDEGYEQFGVKDDDEIRREEEEKESKKKKGSKGNQKINDFLNKRMDKKEGKGSKKQKAQEPPARQMSLMQLKKIMDSRKQRASQQADPEVKVQRQIKEQIYQHNYNEFNGGGDEDELVRKAMQLSLTAATQKQQNLDDYAYKQQEAVNKQLHFSKVSEESQIKEEENFKLSKNKNQKKEKGNEKRARSKSKPKKVVQQRRGPLAGEVIAITGEFNAYDKQEVQEICQQLGAEIAKSITRKCNLLFQGSFVMDHFKRRLNIPVSETTKSVTARERKIDIIDEDDLDKYFITKTGHPISYHTEKNKKPLTTTHSHNYVNINMEDSPERRHFTMDDHIQPIKEKIEIQYQKEEMPQIKAGGWKDVRLWTEKYRPKDLNDVVGQGPQIKQLRQWLMAWEDIHINGNRREVKDNKVGWGAEGNINSSAALVSGEPGIGKTSTARLLAAQLNYLVSEFNASDIRNKSGVNMMESGSFSLDAGRSLQKTLIIMDEVDGMSSGDRGGITAIIQMIKKTKVPIICICNDRSHEKIRSLAGHCLDVRFQRPPKPALVARLKNILKSEGGLGEDRALQLLTETFQNDMRQILSFLQLTFRNTSTHITLNALNARKGSTKDEAVMINHFDAARRLLNRTQFDGLSVHQRNQCFFVDSDLVPLMVQENILSSIKKPKLNMVQFHNMVCGLKGIVEGDLLNNAIRKQQEWGLMPSYGFMSCVYPTQKMSDSIGFPQFPTWLGKNSSQRKNKRICRQVKLAMMPITQCASSKQVKNLYGPLISQEINRCLRNERVQQAVVLMQQYRINPAMMTEHIALVSALWYRVNPPAVIPPAIKAKLTRLYNKRHQDAKLKHQKGKAVSAQHHGKYDPVLEAEVDDIQEQEEVEQEELSAQLQKKVKKAKKK